MNYNQKINKLNSFKDERAFRNFLMDFFAKMGFQGIEETHKQGKPEYGKDIIFYLKNRFDQKDWYALVVKTGNIKGDTSTIENIIFQIKQCFQIPFEHVDEGPIYINKVKVVTNGKLNYGAIDSITKHPELKQISNIEFVWNEKIIEIIDKYFPEYWNEHSSNNYLRPIEQNLFAHLSHELKTPIQTLIVILDTINLKLNGEEKSNEFLNDKINQAQNILFIITKLILNYESLLPYKTEHNYGFNLIDKKKLDKIFNEIIKIFSFYPQRLSLKISNNFKPFKGNANDLELIIFNLIKNAINYCEHNSKIEILVENDSKDNGYANISIKNFGKGLNLEEAKKLFNLYYRETKAKDIYQIGLGIGLFVCKQLIEKMGGNIEVSSLDNSTVFTIKLKN